MESTGEVLKMEKLGKKRLNGAQEMRARPGLGVHHDVLTPSRAGMRLHPRATKQILHKNSP